MGGRRACSPQQPRELEQGRHRHLRGVDQRQRRAGLSNGHPLRQHDAGSVRELADEMVTGRPAFPSCRRQCLPEQGMPLIVDDDRPWKLRSVS